MSLPKFTSHMISNQPDQTAYLLNKLVQEGVGGGEGGKLYDTTGQHTDGAMTQKATTNALGTKADAVTVGNQLATKVDKETGKGLSSNDFTDEDLAKLNGIEAGAEVNVQSDWTQTNNTKDDYIKNKPNLATVATSGAYSDLSGTPNLATVATSGSYTDLTNKPTIPAAQVQSDWDQADNTAVDYIKNKPTIPAGAVLYNSTGQNTDGAMTQKASTDLFNVAAYIDTGTIGSPTPWIQTSDIVDGAVTPDKLSQAYVKTTGDTMTGKLTMSGSGVDMVHLVNGTSSTETFFKSERTDTGTSVRFGVGSGGTNHGVYSDLLGRWMVVADSQGVNVNNVPISFDYLMKYMPFTTYQGTNITTTNINLNSSSYCKVGKYYCTTASAGSTQSNNPSGTAYTMWVINLNSSVLDITDGTWRYFGRLMLALNGLWWQNVNTNGSGTLSFGTWKQLHN